MPRKTALPDVSFLEQPALSSNIFASGANDLAPARQVDIDLIDNNPYQPRESAAEDKMAQLSEVIGAQGFQGVLVARLHPTRSGRYQLAFGHRRRDAARIAGLKTLPLQVRDLTDQDMIEIAITENIQREDLTPLSEGRTYLLMQQQLGYTQEQIAVAIGKTRGYVVNRLRMAQAPADVQAFLEEKPDSIRAAATLIQITDPAARAELMSGMLNGTLTTNDLPGYRRDVLSDGDAPAIAEPAAPYAAANDQLRLARSKVIRPSVGSDDARRSAERAGRLKLGTAWESLVKFERQAEERGDISLHEYTKLSELRELVERLFNRYSPPAEE